ncbi:hypothetical protein D3C73_1061340 [compost metagenome]
MRPPQQNGDHQRDVREQGRLGKQKARVVGHQADQQRADQAADRGPQAADHDDDENQHVHLRTQLWHDRLLVHAPQDAAQPGQHRPSHEHAHEQMADTVAQAFDHFAVFDARADQQPQLGTVQQPQHAAQHQQADSQGNDAEFLDRRIT